MRCAIKRGDRLFVLEQTGKKRLHRSVDVGRERHACPQLTLLAPPALVRVAGDDRATRTSAGDKSTLSSGRIIMTGFCETDGLDNGSVSRMFLLY